MAKKQKTQEVEVPVVKTPVVETPKPKKVEPKKPTWEIKDRTYFLTNNRSPLTKSIRATDIYYFDEEKGFERELKYTSNQRTPFVDEMKGDQRLEHIIFENGVLNVPKNKTVLQQLLSLYHPHRGSLFTEFKPVEEAVNEIDYLEMEIEALNAAQGLDIGKGFSLTITSGS